jgi:riboflavin kinase / FMN adenylyltransferase
MRRGRPNNSAFTKALTQQGAPGGLLGCIVCYKNLDMRIFRGFHRPGGACALTIGNFDGVHRGHQAMLALLRSEAAHRGLPSCVLTFEPHPRDYFSALAGKPDTAPARIATLRDKLTELARCGIDEVVVLPFNATLSEQTAQNFIDSVLVQGLKARYVLVGDDFQFGAKRGGNYAMLDAAGDAAGFEVARMMSYEVHQLRVSSSAVREALAQGRMTDAKSLLGRHYSVSGHVVHGQKLGRELGFRTLNLRFDHPKPAASGIFAVQVHGLGEHACGGVASFGVRPTVTDNGRVLLEVHLFEDCGDAYGKLVHVDLLCKLHDELKYDCLDALKAGIASDTALARAWWLKHQAQLPA